MSWCKDGGWEGEKANVVSLLFLLAGLRVFFERNREERENSDNSDNSDIVNSDRSDNSDNGDNSDNSDNRYC